MLNVSVVVCGSGDRGGSYTHCWAGHRPMGLWYCSDDNKSSTGYSWKTPSDFVIGLRLIGVSHA